MEYGPRPRDTLHVSNSDTDGSKKAAAHASGESAGEPVAAQPASAPVAQPGPSSGSPGPPYLVQLLAEGFLAGLPVPGLGQRYRWNLAQASGELLDRSLNPVQVMRWFTNNPDTRSQAEQSQTLLSLLEEAKSWEEAAQSLWSGSTTGRRRRIRTIGYSGRFGT
jgi:hypothetical protein